MGRSDVNRALLIACITLSNSPCLSLQAVAFGVDRDLNRTITTDTQGAGTTQPKDDTGTTIQEQEHASVNFTATSVDQDSVKNVVIPVANNDTAGTNDDASSQAADSELDDEELKTPVATKQSEEAIAAMTEDSEGSKKTESSMDEDDDDASSTAENVVTESFNVKLEEQDKDEGQHENPEENDSELGAEKLKASIETNETVETTMEEDVNDASAADEEAKIATKPLYVELEEQNSSEESSVKDDDVPKEASIPKSSAQVNIDGDNHGAAVEEDAGSVPKRQEDGDSGTAEIQKHIQEEVGITEPQQQIIDSTKSTESESDIMDLDDEDGEVVTKTATSRPSSEESVADPPKAQVDDAGEGDSNEKHEAGTPQPQVDEVAEEDSNATSTTTAGEESSSLDDATTKDAKSTSSESDILDLDEEDNAVEKTAAPLSLEESETDTPESRVEDVSKEDSDEPSTETAKKDDSSSLDDGTTKNAKEAAPEGSLAGFFEKINNKQKKTEPSLTSDNVQASSSSSSFESLAQQAEENNAVVDAHEAETQKRTEAAQNQQLIDYGTSSWGVYSKKKRVPDMDLLYMMFEDRVRKELGIVPDSLLREAIFPLGVGNAEEDDKDASSTQQLDEDANKSSDFVEGLDDIDKFFEGVDPPDELDVGANGSSIQEVLIGQGKQILFKRVRLGVGFLRRLFTATKSKLLERFTNEDGHFVVTKEHLGEAAIGMWRAIGRAYHQIVDFVDELVEGGSNEDEELNMDFRMNLRDPKTIVNLGPPLQEKEEDGTK